MKLSHYTEAEKCAQYIKSLQPDYLRTYLYTAQIAYYNKAASIQQVKDAQRLLQDEGLPIAGLACANSTFFLPLMKQLEKYRSLLEEKVEGMIKKEVSDVEQIITKAEKIYKFKTQ